MTAKRKRRKDSRNKSHSSSDGSGSAATRWQGWLNTGLAVLCIAAAAICLPLAVRHLHEQARFFSALTTTEREISFTSEQAMYYAYFKKALMTIEDTPGMLPTKIMAAINAFVHDTRIEHPSSVNALQRFNVYPELVIATAMHIWRSVHAFIWGEQPQQTCMQYQQAGGSTYMTCTGAAVPIYFYINSVFGLQSLAIASLLFLVWEVSGNSAWSVIAAIIFIAVNFDEMTRVMWGPPLRESFGFPFWMAQVALITHALRQYRTRVPSALMAVHVCLLVAFAASWQFAPFALAVQMCALALLFALGALPRPLLVAFASSQTLAWGISIALQFFNAFMITSAYTATIIGLWVSVIALPLPDGRVWRFLRFPLFLITTAAAKAAPTLLLSHQQDSHVLDMLKAKFRLAPGTFHTKLYTCASAFDFLPAETYWRFTTSLVLPLAVIVVAASGIAQLRRLLRSDSNGHATSITAGLESARLFAAVMACGFFVLAVLVMRLKLFATPLVIVMASVAFSPEAVRQVLTRPFMFGMGTASLHKAISIGLISAVLFNGYGHVSRLASKQGEFNDASTLEL
ncbi:hypothetical protein PTSG_05849 [Salpingoeca rosetta]|uniref:Uncharacterized protein n=1 Tax=Salpingoeca rosetta (strain ATCC 50818 / BSB-021) TaxID=946362 RepID=F2UCZ0_SALR5|nr:uncharacterized protein PTSG_05849 [Salpingoeca rosetta]EGD74485.1 hypothetical protein PTSG_05849 [Salpingoeca rosetta]|eukprot:XP_004992742.1 hypothetical protein PTSG_05849 [Salpingoeca rosetta]